MFNQFEPTVRVAFKFLQLLNVKVNETTLNNVLENHPDWPSLVCITDALDYLNVPNGAGSIDITSIDELPIPFIANIEDSENPLVVVTQVSEKQVKVYYGSNKKSLNINKDDFIKKWNGIYLIAEPNSNSGELDFTSNRKKNIIKKIIPVALTIIVTLLISSFINKIISIPSISAKAVTLGIYSQFLISVVGVVITILLVWYEIDQDNPLLKKVCSGFGKVNCSAILTSKQSKVFTWLSWSEVGLFFFMGSFIAMLFGNERMEMVIPTVGWLYIISLPYILFSLYYQLKVIKQWCILCLSVQALLLLGSINAFANGFLTDFHVTSINTVVNTFLLYALPVLTWFSIKPYIIRLQQAKNTHRQLLRLKFNESVFNTLLKKQKKINYPLKELGINLGNPNANNTIIKVCNVYCGPCSKAHPEIEKLLKLNDDLKVKIIFTFKDQESDPSAIPARHLLAIAAQNNNTQLENALTDWYALDAKNYALFAARYPMNGELAKQDKHLTAMKTWCMNTNITHTPTFFVNGFELPESYSIEDLQHFLRDASPIGQG